MRRKLIAGNWKMNMTLTEAIALTDALLQHGQLRSDIDVAICPPFTALSSVYAKTKGSKIALGAQNMFWREKGAFTGQISPAMLKDVGCQYVIIGHSETRGRFGVMDDELPKHAGLFAETNQTVNLKVKTALLHNLTPIMCVGETITEREAGQTDSVIAKQIEEGLAGLLPEEAVSVIIAYEPVWAIGTGKVCDTAEAQRVCKTIRGKCAELFNSESANAMRILYGGSVKGSNSQELMRQEDIDGALVGGASLDASDFSAIIMNA